MTDSTSHLTNEIKQFPISHAMRSQTPAHIRTTPAAIPSTPTAANRADYLRILGINGLSSHRLSLRPLLHHRAPATHPAHPTHLHFTPFWVSPFSPWPPLPSPPPLCTAASWRRARPGRRSASSGCSCGGGGQRAVRPGPTAPPPKPAFSSHRCHPARLSLTALSR